MLLLATAAYHHRPTHLSPPGLTLATPIIIYFVRLADCSCSLTPSITNLKFPHILQLIRETYNMDRTAGFYCILWPTPSHILQRFICFFLLF